MHVLPMKSNCDSMEKQQNRQLEQQQKQLIFNNYRRRKSRKKYNEIKTAMTTTTITSATPKALMQTTANDWRSVVWRRRRMSWARIFTSNATTTQAEIGTTTIVRANINKYNCNYNNFNKINKLLLITTMLLITMIATTTICQIEATPALASVSSSSQVVLSPLTILLQTGGTSSSIAAAALSSAHTHQQQEQHTQLPQQQLFAMLTKNRQPSVLGSGPITTKVGKSGGKQHFILPEDDNDSYGEDYDDDNRDDIIMSAVAKPRQVATVAAASLETTGYVADDGQQYEKAEKALTAAGIIRTTMIQHEQRINPNIQTTNANNCPKECKCLNDYFDCGKQHLDRVPSLPNYVQMLDLVGNKLNDTTVLEIKDLPELHKLLLKRNQLDVVPKFSGLVALRHLNLANNRIQHISSDALVALPKLKLLDLSKNYLHALESNYFPKSNRLAHLLLNSNEISKIDELSFESLADLIDLELNNNRLQSLPGGVFKNLNKLKKLALNNNQLEINWSTFRGLKALQKLFLKSNNIRALQDGVFHVMCAIETIELDHNGITSLSRQGLFNLTKLHYLSLSNNSITRIEPDTWEFTQSLVSLDLSHNNISEFKPQHLDCLQRLKHLNLGHNKIQYLMDNTFDCVKNLEDLNLRRNKLAWIIEDQGATPAFKALRKLKKLDLYGNNLKQLNSKSLLGLNSLESLNLGSNALATIQSGAFEHMTQLQKLIFKSFNFICDCELLWFRRWLQKTFPGNAQMQGNVVCGYPEHLLDRELLMLTPAELVCAGTPKPLITQEPNNQLAVKGANITMECVANSPAAASLAAADELKIKWRHDNQNIRERPTTSFAHQHQVSSASGSYSIPETQIHHDPSTNETTIIGYLRLYNVSYDSAGKYQCVVSNAFGTTYSQKFKISIGIHPTFLQTPSNLTIDSGDTARLVCSATGDPMPEISLQKFGAINFQAATERRLQVIREENAFLFTNAKPVDSGIYTCTAESAAGEIKINATLIVNDKPQPIIPLTRKEIVLGKTCVLECLYDLDDETNSELQQPHREWYKENKLFHISATTPSERYYFTAEKELLVIVNTQSNDAGHYRCEIMDNLKMLTLQTELVVVKEDFSQNMIIIGVVMVTVACILIGSLIIWTMLCYQKRKLFLHNARHRMENLNHFSASEHGLNGSHGSAVDQNQLTTLNRTYLRQQLQQQPHQQQHQVEQQRPHSLADYDPEQQSCLIINTTPNYRQRLDEEEGLTLAYLQNNHEREQQQDHLSSKDSGTGSDAAVKRSIEDFTLNLLPYTSSNENALAAATSTTTSTPTPTMTSQSAAPHIVNYLHDDDDDSDLQFAPTRALGVSEYDNFELCEVSQSNFVSGSAAEQQRLLQNNNHNYDGDGVGQSLGLAHKYNTQLSTNFNTKNVVTTVDI